MSCPHAFSLTLTLAAAALGCGPPPAAVRDGAGASHAGTLHPDGWCDACGAGFVAAIRVPSRELFEVLDAHGHDVDAEALSCGACRQASKNGGFCDACRMGFVNGHAYLSRLAYHAARAKVEDPAALECSTCRASAGGHGWCDRCDAGRVGVLRVASRADLEELRKAVAKLHKAVERLDRCQRCALATFTDGGCRSCALSYRDGEPVARHSPHAPR